MPRIKIPSSGEMIFHDSFTAANSTVLDGHYPDVINMQNASWIKANTYPLDIQGGKVTMSVADAGGNGTEYKDNDHYIDAGFSGLTVECDLQINNQDETIFHSVVIRYIDNLNSTAVQWQTIGGAYQNLQIREQVNSAGSSDIGTPHSFADTSGIDSEQTLRIVDDGATITATLMGETATATTSNNARATKIAIRTSEHDTNTWDNFKVWKT